jgi:hypothetical protein
MTNLHIINSMKGKIDWIELAARVTPFGAVSKGGKLALPWRAWRGGLIERHGEEQGQALLEKSMGRWRELVETYPKPLPKPPLRNHLVNNMLTGLALYQTLLEQHGGDHPAALAEIEPLFQEWTRQLYGGLMKTFNRLPFVFWFFRIGIVANLLGFPAESWRTTWLEDNGQRVAFDHFSCPYVDTLKAYRAPELTPYFCRIDDWMAEMLPPTIAFKRTQTLGDGGDFCDFCYERVNKKLDQHKGEA